MGYPVPSGIIHRSSSIVIAVTDETSIGTSSVNSITIRFIPPRPYKYVCGWCFREKRRRPPVDRHVYLYYWYTIPRESVGTGSPTVRRRSRRRIRRCVNPTTTTHISVNDDHKTRRSDTLWKTTTTSSTVHHSCINGIFSCVVSDVGCIWFRVAPRCASVSAKWEWRQNNWVAYRAVTWIAVRQKYKLQRAFFYITTPTPLNNATTTTTTT